MRMCCIILLSVDYLVLLRFSTLRHKRFDFWERVIEHKMRVLIFFLQSLSEKFLILGRIQLDMIYKCVSADRFSTGYCCRVLLELEISRSIF